MPSAVYDFDAIAEVLRRGKPKASTADHGDMRANSGLKHCSWCGFTGWLYFGSGKWKICYCGNPNGRPCPPSTP